ncbi:hypothetical protein D3C87_1492340 [compost metagenome]
MHRVSPWVASALALSGCAQSAVAPSLPERPRHAVRMPQQAGRLPFVVQQRSGRRSPVEGGALRVLRDWQEIGPPGFRNYEIYRSGYQYPFYYGAYYPYSGIYVYGPPISPKVEKELKEQADAAGASSEVAAPG